MELSLFLRKEILRLFKECLATKDDLEVSGQSRFNNFLFSEEALESHREEIYSLFVNIIGDKKHASFEELHANYQGKRWTDVNFYIDILMSMINALDYGAIITNDQKEYTIVKK